jgi:hypothetical protein
VESGHEENAHDGNRSGWKPGDTAARDGRRYNGAQLCTTANPDKSLEKERRVHAAAWQKGSPCRLKPAFLGDGVELCPLQRTNCELS